MRNIGRIKEPRRINRTGSRSQFFSFNDFLRALQLMATPFGGQRLSTKERTEAKMKFFSKLQKLIDRQNARSVTNGLNNNKTIRINDPNQLTPESYDSVPRVKKTLNNSVLGPKRPNLKKLNKFPDLTSLKNPYQDTLKFKNPSLRFGKRGSKLKLNKSLRGGKKKSVKRKEYNMIDLSHNKDGNSIESYSGFDISSEDSFPPLEKNSPKDSIDKEDEKRIARSLERPKCSKQTATEPLLKSKRTFNKRASGSINNSISISENAVSDSIKAI